MAQYIIKSESTKATKSVLSKFAKIPVDNHSVRGIINIVGYRKYRIHEEVDIEFTGDIYAKIGPEGCKWHDASAQKKYSLSKVKLNRLIRKSVHFEVQTRMNYFDSYIRFYGDIKKVNWK